MSDTQALWKGVDREESIWATTFMIEVKPVMEGWKCQRQIVPPNYDMYEKKKERSDAWAWEVFITVPGLRTLSSVGFQDSATAVASSLIGQNQG